MKFLYGYYFIKCRKKCNYCEKSKIAKQLRSHSECEKVTLHVVDHVFSTTDTTIKFQVSTRNQFVRIKFGIIMDTEWNSIKRWTHGENQNFYGKQIWLYNKHTLKMKLNVSNDTIQYIFKSGRTITEKYKFRKSLKYKIYAEFFWRGIEVKIL